MIAEKMKKNAETRLAVAKSKCAALEIECDAESTQHENMAPTRKHKQKMKLNSCLWEIGRNGNVVVSGQNGQNILNFYNKAIDEITNDSTE